jgi:transketolase
MAIEAFAPLLPELIGGSADLAHSNLTLWKGSKSVATDDPNANYIYYGVREFAMTAISNGLGLHECFIPYDATFLVFSDYARNAVRMSALMGAHAIHVYTHRLRSAWARTARPTSRSNTSPRCATSPATTCGARATRSNPRCAGRRRSSATTARAAWIFSRQNLPHQPRNAQQVADIERGGYVLRDSVGAPEIILIATGSEVGLAMQAAEQLGDKARVVSMPSTDVFERQDAQYRESVLPRACRKRIAIEAGVTGFWRPVRRPGRRRRRHRQLRRQRPDRTAAAALRLHRGEGARGGAVAGLSRPHAVTKTAPDGAVFVGGQRLVRQARMRRVPLVAPGFSRHPARSIRKRTRA